jgi:hypothetical protein
MNACLPDGNGKEEEGTRRLWGGGTKTEWNSLNKKGERRNIRERTEQEKEGKTNHLLEEEKTLDSCCSGLRADSHHDLLGARWIGNLEIRGLHANAAC